MAQADRFLGRSEHGHGDFSRTPLLERLRPNPLRDGRIPSTDPSPVALRDQELRGQHLVWSAGRHQRRPRLSGSAVLALRFLLHAIEPRVVVGELVEVRQCDLASHDRVVAGDVRR